MYFDYEAYRAYCFESPMMCVVIFSLGLVGGILGAVIKAIKKELVKEDIVFLRVGIPMVILVVSITGGELLYGGIYLYHEQETDAVEMQGEITDIKGLGDFVFPTVKDGRGYEEENGYEFTIDGVKCAANRKGSLKVGDYVTVRYLPKSGYILYIAEIEEESSAIAQ
ncbi:MAG: hypothetical protein NC399_00160 [Muribaculum sp.]|nr:hypothetical protein [Muribaculum sp.]